MQTKYQTPLNLGFQFSPDITIEFIKQKDPVVDRNEVHEIDDDDDYESCFNPLFYCAITMADEDDDATACRNDMGNQPTISQKTETVTKGKNQFKNPHSNENSSFVCNGADSSSVGKIKKRFSCHICNKTFGWTTDLKRHILIHTGERPFKCTMCFATFTRNFLLQKHKTKIHQCLSPNEISQLNNNVAKNLMEIKLKMRELEEGKEEIEDEDTQPESKKARKM